MMTLFICGMNMFVILSCMYTSGKANADVQLTVITANMYQQLC